MTEASANFTRHSRAFSASARNALGHQPSMGRDAATILVIETQLRQLSVEHSERFMKVQGTKKHVEDGHRRQTLEEEEEGLVEKDAVVVEDKDEDEGRSGVLLQGVGWAKEPTRIPKRQW
ncbi:hypothetical protein CH63R_09592 [Colletotrichum higginsianum IMI 349063]|uniref:Uncharacterized protein n=2 Tax=Colletotrichum higginsianum TaxID=80884 RepID=A0A1B7Y7P4_COLHI|nr:hypothetical protein CH63R_09592 [Colletotrichum higginsianum IMI 349063]OBR08071.1 hypothetical protein CH63R_09592 [Colletotrichum higginsianum IMI 349063]TIC91820.1 hypothetical protein CH35J_010948 [Colletotrichum higginsianum]GJC97837.1 hypothetical protein ColKHC_06663 [Colletotrichum higginsianum]